MAREAPDAELLAESRTLDSKYRFPSRQGTAGNPPRHRQKPSPLPLFRESEDIRRGPAMPMWERACILGENRKAVGLWPIGQR